MLAVHNRTLVVMPAFNESSVIETVIDEVRDALPEISLLVVDDGSTDDTAARARAAGALVLQLPFNLGVGGAMRAGYKFATQNGFTNVVQVDADGQHNPADVLELIEKLDGADIVIGARFAGRGAYSVSGPRRWAMVALAWTITKLAKTDLTDTTSGFRATGPRATRLFAEHFPAEYLGDTIESLVLASRAGYVIRQVPVEMRQRAGGTPSNNSLQSAVYLGRAIIALTMSLIRPRLQSSHTERSL